MSLSTSIINKLLGTTTTLRVRKRGDGVYSYEIIPAVQTFTVTIAAPGVVTKATHGFVGGEKLRLFTTGALPTGLVVATDYFVLYVSANTFNLSLTFGGAAITTTGTQSGTQTYGRVLAEKRYPRQSAEDFLAGLYVALNTVA